MAILKRARGHVNPSLKANLSVGEISRPLGDLSRIRNLPHARDWRVRARSASPRAVRDLMSYLISIETGLVELL